MSHRRVGQIDRFRRRWQVERKAHAWGNKGWSCTTAIYEYLHRQSHRAQRLLRTQEFSTATTIMSLNPTCTFKRGRGRAVYAFGAPVDGRPHSERTSVQRTVHLASHPARADGERHGVQAVPPKGACSLHPPRSAVAMNKHSS